LVVGLSATVGQLFLTRAFTGGMPAKVSVAGLSQVAFAMLYEGLFEGRAFNWLTLVGIGLVLAPTAWLLLGRR
jgi:drug/metabolite transporter (DMT)-like permease